MAPSSPRQMVPPRSVVYGCSELPTLTSSTSTARPSVQLRRMRESTTSILTHCPTETTPSSPVTSTPITRCGTPTARRLTRSATGSQHGLTAAAGRSSTTVARPSRATDPAARQPRMSPSAARPSRSGAPGVSALAWPTITSPCFWRSDLRRGPRVHPQTALVLQEGRLVGVPR